MEVHWNDKLAKVLSGINTDTRFTNWLWLFIKTHFPQESLGEFRAPGMRNRMAELISQNPQGVGFIEEQSKLSLLSEHNLQWITNSKRQNTFLVQKLLEKNSNNLAINSTPLINRELTIATIDILQIGIIEKLSLMYSLVAEWQILIQADQTFKWFDGPEEKEKLELACELMIKKYSSQLPCTPSFQEKEDILMYFDKSYLSALEKELFVNSVKKRWSQNKYRAKMTGKKQYNFILSDKAIKRLDRLADKHELKRTQVLEILLQMEDQKGIYIPERLKILMDA